MNRFIDAYNLVYSLVDICDSKGHMIKSYAVLEEDIDNAPTIDAVHVVRCKDCTFYNSEIGNRHNNRKWRKHHGWQCSDWFCADAELKDGVE